MPPSPGRIHSLPVKVLYSIDTSPQSFLTVLPDRQEVYVHNGSPAYGPETDRGPAGSCTLKAIGRGICFASPECIPNATTLDFSVYNLDPSARLRGSSRAFSPSTDPASSSWTGRGFLSWALSELGQGQTLIKGRLIREYEFASTHFAAEGGLEGLMAAASRSNGNREDEDGKGWGLEVAISLRQLNPEGKVEFQGRKEFEDMLAHGKSLSVGGATSPAGTPSSAPQRSSPHPSLRGATTPVSTAQPQAGPSSAATVRPPLAQPSPLHQQPNLPRPSSSMSQRQSFSSTLPPSSLPPGPSSSASNVPSSRPSSAADSRPPVKHETMVESRSQTSREVTPPPLPRPKSPPPSTPSRAKLHALLRADGAMSPDLARHLASNPVLRNLLKAVPSNSNALAALRNITGINNPPVDLKGKQRENGADREGSPEQATTPTPSTNILPRSTTEGCCNCGTMHSSCWRTKKMKDGTPRKVCDDCGLYFNKHKRMRPPELWSRQEPESASKTSGQVDTKRKAGHVENLDGPAGGLRSSPRLNRTNSDSTTHTLHSQNLPNVPESPRKRQRTGKPVPQPSPRMATRASAKVDGPASGDFSAEAFGFSPNTIFGTSPPDAMGVGAGPSIGSVMAGMGHLTQPPPHIHSNSHIPGAAVGLVGPHDTGSTGGMDGEFDISALLAQMETAAGGTAEGFDFNSLFAGFGEPSATGNGAGAGIGAGTGMDGAGIGHVELSQEMMDLLAGWEGQIVAGLEADTTTNTHGHQNGNGHITPNAPGPNGNS